MTNSYQRFFYSWMFTVKLSIADLLYDNQNTVKQKVFFSIKKF